ncbi:MAG TPA: ArsC family reductase [Methylophilaceae bacterium]|nr:ArsC family reductase [Methylophilaceae bacterium]
MKLYGIPNCNTVKKARTWLEERQVDYMFHDFKKAGLNQNLLDNWLSQQSWEKLVNRAGMTWRKLDDATKSSITDNNSAAKLMLDKTSVIKRPILENDGRILAIGFQEEKYKELFK